MDEESLPLPVDEPTNITISNRRLLVEMAVLILAGAFAGFIFGGWRFGSGVLFGGMLAFANYYWLKRSTAAIFNSAAMGLGAGWVSVRFIARYVALVVVILAVHFSGMFPATSVIAGLGAFAAAVVVEGFTSIFRRNI